MAKITISKETMKSTLFASLNDQGYTIRGNKFVPPVMNSKESIRAKHFQQRLERLQQEAGIFNKYGQQYLTQYFANGNQVNLNAFDPVLIQVKSQDWTSILFRLATMLWSIPVSKGYGRRLRFLVMDKSNGCLVGIIGLGDPVFNLKVRDEHIGWSATQRKEKLYHVMDAYILGAVPPYNYLMAGKYLAGLFATNEIREAFKNKYNGRKTIIEGKEKVDELVLITTTSALGKSSIYNRVSYVDAGQHKRTLLTSLGYTSGYGHFHVNDEIFLMMRTFLEERNDSYANGYEFGNGPNWRMRVIDKTMRHLGYSKLSVLHHGIQREVFACPLASNYKEFLLGNDFQPHYFDLPMSDYTNYFLNRYMVPRYIRKNDEILAFDSGQLYQQLYIDLTQKDNSREERVIGG